MNEPTRAKLLATLKRAEGRKPMLYEDPRGVKSVGYGHNLESGPPLSDAAMDQILDDDLADVERRCRRFPWFDGLDDVRQAAILELSFNVGLGGLGTFRKMLAAVVNQDYETAAVEMLDSKWATQVGPRAHRLAAMMRTGTWA